MKQTTKNMTLTRRTVLSAGAAAVLGTLGPSTFAAEPWPTKAITLVVPYTAGGGSDILARAFATRLSERLGQSVIVDNRAGGNTLVATRFGQQQKPDGHTLYLIPPQFSIGPAVQADLFNYDPTQDFTPIARLTSIVLVLIANPSTPFSSVQDLIAYARKNPDKLNMATTGAGSSPHLAGEVFKAMTGTKITLVQYKGASNAMQDLIGGVVDIRFDSMPTALPMIQAGRVKALGIATRDKSTLLPNIPTIQQTVPGYEIAGYYGLVGPKGLPSDIVARLSTLSKSIMGEPDLQKSMANLGLETSFDDAVGYRTYLKNDSDYWATTAKRLKIEVRD